MNAADFELQHRITDADLKGYIEAPDAGKNVVSILAYHDAVTRKMLGETMAGDTLPWTKTHGHFRLRPGEVTLWFGINGHGKSALTSQVALHLAAIQARRCCLASFEMAPVDTLCRMVCQAAGTGKPSVSFGTQFFTGLCQRLWIYDRVKRIDAKYLFAAIRYCAQTKGVSHFFIDSLMKCVRGADDYNAQKDFVEDLTLVAKETGTHIHIIHHSKKLEDEKRIPNKFDAKGAGEISDLVDNVLIVWKDKAKERENHQALATGVPQVDDRADFMLACEKQRHHPWEGMWALWGDMDSWHFRESAPRGWANGYEMPKYEPKQDEPGAAG